MENQCCLGFKASLNQLKCEKQKENQCFWRFRASLNQLKSEKPTKKTVFGRFMANLNQLRCDKTTANHYFWRFRAILNQLKYEENNRKIGVFWRFRAGLNHLQYQQNQRQIIVFWRFRAGLNQLKYENQRKIIVVRDLGRRLNCSMWADGRPQNRIQLTVDAPRNPRAFLAPPPESTRDLGCIRVGRRGYTRDLGCIRDLASERLWIFMAARQPTGCTVVGVQRAMTCKFMCVLWPLYRGPMPPLRFQMPPIWRAPMGS